MKTYIVLVVIAAGRSTGTRSGVIAIVVVTTDLVWLLGETLLHTLPALLCGG